MGLQMSHCSLRADAAASEAAMSPCHMRIALETPHCHAIMSCTTADQVARLLDGTTAHQSQKPCCLYLAAAWLLMHLDRVCPMQRLCVCGFACETVH